MAEILGLAVAAAFYPVLLAGVLLILTRPEPRRLLLAFLVGGMAVSLLAGTLILVVVQDSGALTGSSKRTLSPAVDIAVGVLSLVVAVVLWRRRDRPRKEHGQPQWLSRRLARGSPWLAFGIGVVLNLPGIYYLAALKEISVGGYGTVTAALLLIVFNLIMFTLVEVPLLWYIVSPDAARRRVARLDAWIHAHSSQLGVIIAAAAGAYLCAKGLRGALS